MIANNSHDDASTPDPGRDDLRRAFPPGAEPPFHTPVTVLVATAKRKGRRRRVARVSARTALVAVPAIAAVALLANYLPATRGATLAPPAASSGPPAPSVAPPQAVVACTGAQLSGKVFHAGSVASQPFVEIVLTNDGPSSCQLSGYPKLAVWGSTGPGPRSVLNIALTRGSSYEVTDPGPSDVVIGRGKFAWFAIGSGTAYGGPFALIDQVVMDMVPAGGAQAGQVTIPLTMDAGGPPQGKAIPISVTAFAPGVPPKP